MKNDVLISVIVPVYNVEKYLERCVESIIKQTYQNHEIILVNDGSTDGSGELCDRMALKDKRIITLHQKNGGSVLARRRGLEAATGEYMAFVDSDDWIEENMYASLLDIMLRTGADFVHSDCYHEFETGVIREEIRYAGKNLYDERDDKADILYDSIFSENRRKKINQSIWSKLFKTEFARFCFYKIPEEQCIGEDLLFLCECIINSKKIAISYQSFYHYLLRKDSMIHCIDEDRLAEISLLYLNLKKVLKSYGYFKRFDADLKRWFNMEICNLLKSGIFKLEIVKYQFGKIDLVKDKKIVLYGAGKVGKDYYAQLCKYHSCRIGAWVDADYKKQQNNPYYPITAPENMLSEEFDYVIIALSNEKTAGEVRDWMKSAGIKKEKILWESPVLLGGDL